MNQTNNRIRDEWREQIEIWNDTLSPENEGEATEIVTNWWLSKIDELLKSQREVYKDALIWCSGSEDFQIEGKAREGWEKICLPLIKEE
jgi:hypothetical protein